MPRRSLLQTAVQAWEAIQVELHGRYSIQRLRALSTYCADNATRPVRTAAILLLTPLPCLGAILLADSLPLRPPGQGIEHNKMFWFRAFVGAWFFTISFVVQFSQSLPMLPMTRSRVLAITWVVSVGGTAVVMALSLAVGFPMPFMMVLATPGWIAFLVGSLGMQWGSAIRANPSVWPMVVNCLKVFSIQMSLLVVYPVYNYFFQRLEGAKQALFSLVLHAIKIGAKNAIGRYITHMEDMRPEVVIFNVEVFSALFTSFCMQNASSLLTTIVLVLADFAHACLALNDVNRMLSELKKLEVASDKITRAIGVNSGPSEPSAKASDIPKTRALAVEETVGTASDESVLLRAMLKLTRSGTTISGSQPTQLAPPTPAWCSTGRMERSGSKRSRRIRWMAAVIGFVRSKVSPSDVATRITVTVAPTAQILKRTDVRTRNSVDTSVADLPSMTPLSTDHQYVETVFKLLHLTEFTILVEYTEVIIPAVYSVYLIIMSRLPNHVHYPHLADMDDMMLYQNVRNVLLYSGLELLSFLALQRLLKKRLHLSASLQLAFVLEKQWEMVQSKLVLWVMYIVQASLIHFGADYTFRFKWLREENHP